MATPRLRRSSDEVRELMLDAARTLFRNQGYDATSTRQISEHAGVAESALFRHFGSKKAVFDEAILRPVVQFVQAFIDDWVARPAADVVPEQLSYRFVAGLSQLCNDNPDLIEILGKKDVDGQGRPLAGQATALMQEFVDTLTMQVETYHTDVGLDFGMAPRLSVQLAIALIVGAAHLGEGFLGEMDDRLIAEMAAFVVRGAGYPGDGRVRKANSPSRARLARAPAASRRRRRR